jgi:hypothetical protein
MSSTWGDFTKTILTWGIIYRLETRKGGKEGEYYTDSGIRVSLSTKSEKVSRSVYTMIWIYIRYQPDVCNVLVLPKCE